MKTKMQTYNISEELNQIFGEPGTESRRNAEEEAWEEYDRECMTPSVATHPGAILKDELEFRGISQRKLAEEMGIRYTVLNEILNGHRPLTEKTALLFEAVLGVDSEPLMRLQTKYNMLTIKQDRSFMERLSKLRHIAAF